MVKKVSSCILSFFYDFVLEDNMIYFPMANYNAICKGNLDNDQVDIINIFPNIPTNKRVAYSGVCKFDNFLLFSPNNDKDEVIIYNILQNTFSGFDKKNFNFYSSNVFKKNNFIYIVSVITAKIYKVDLQNNSSQCIVCKDYIADNAQISELIRIENYIFIPLNQKKVMLIFDLDNEKFECFKYPENILFISTICYQNSKFWISSGDRKLYTWDIKEGEVQKCADFPEDIIPFYSETVYFGKSFIYQNVLWLFPLSTDTILKYNIETKRFEQLRICGEEEEKEGDELENGRFFSAKYVTRKYKNKVFFISSKTRILYELDLITEDIKKHCFPVVNLFDGRLYPVSENERMYEENYTNGLELLIKELLERDKQPVMEKEASIGKRVEEYINSEL